MEEIEGDTKRNRNKQGRGVGREGRRPASTEDLLPVATALTAVVNLSPL